MSQKVIVTIVLAVKEHSDLLLPSPNIYVVVKYRRGEGGPVKDRRTPPTTHHVLSLLCRKWLIMVHMSWMMMICTGSGSEPQQC